MKRLFPFVFFFVAASSLSSQSADFQMAKNTDIYFSLLKGLSLFYVDTVDFDDLIPASMDKMLQLLDPYTVRISEDAAGDFDFSTTGEYGGVGMLIRKRGQHVEIAELYKGFPAQKAGVNVGDRILAIDTVDLQKKDITDISGLLKGKIGTELALTVLQYSTKDTVRINVVRQKIHLPAVPYFGIVADTKIGYVYYSTFTTNGSDEVKRAVVKLKEEGAAAIILDLRNNTGGLLEEAVEAVNCFVPKGQNVVSIKGRGDKETRFKTTHSPVDANIPLVVLINNMSASSSEIVAGALQDLDRAVVVGQKSFGKGLVQSVVPLPFNQRLKMTTARYYTPSGRCVQAINYSRRSSDDDSDSTLRRTFATAGGRPVFDAGGITPDVALPRTKYSVLLQALMEKDIIYDYATYYYAAHSNAAISAATFAFSDADYEDFISYSKTLNFTYQTVEEQKFAEFEKTLKTRADTADFVACIADIKTALQQQKSNDLLACRAEIQPFIEQEIVSRYHFQWGRIQTSIRCDSEIDEAVRLLQDKDLYHSKLKAAAR